MVMPGVLTKTKRPLLMGIVNVTGDSFSEGSLSSPGTAVERALRLLEEGADLLDIGAESTRPGAAEVSASTEIERLDRVLDALWEKAPGTIVSIDTRHAETARKMIEKRAAFINDVSMLRFDPEMAEVLKSSPETGVILCHSRGTPETMNEGVYRDYGKDTVQCICDELAASVEKAGLSRDRVIFDPGFGFAKSFEQQLDMLRHAGRFVSLLGNVLFGISRKSFIGELTGEKDPALRSGGTLAAELHLAGCGAQIIRTHNVKMLKDALAVAGALKDEERSAD